MNGRAGSLGLTDVRGALGFGIDEFSWLNTLYAAGELLVMPFASWFAITFSMRRFHLAMVASASLLAIVIPFIVDLRLLLALRMLQGMCAGALIPLLMMAALKMLPPHIRLHGLALYAMTATFAPNVSIWLVGQWTDVLGDWRWLYWQFVPAAAVSGSLVAWGLPREPILWSRFSSFNMIGLSTGAPALVLLAVAIDQGNRLDWLASPMVATCFAVGAIFLTAYIASEWRHPSPFIRFQLLSRRNLYLCFLAFVILLVVLVSGAVLPSLFLTSSSGYRSLQNAPIGLLIGMPQIVLGSVVAVLLYQKWVDARLTFIIGLCLIALSCFVAASVDPSWMWREFLVAQLMQAVGQPLAVVSMLFLATSVVQPAEGPYIAGCINTLRALGSLIGGASVTHLIDVRSRFHSDVLSDRLGAVGRSLPAGFEVESLTSMIGSQVLALSVADAYRVLGVLALSLVPVVLLTKFIPAPSLPDRLRPNLLPQLG
jgi:DHA2 family multidrug resistance protein